MGQWQNWDMAVEKRPKASYLPCSGPVTSKFWSMTGPFHEMSKKTFLTMLAEDAEKALAEILVVDWRDGDLAEVN
jgi:hypothetical protein